MLTPTFAIRYDITHVINCAFSEDSPEWWRIQHPGKYVCLEAIDSRTGVNILDWYGRFEAAMQGFLREGSGVVYVHCQAGMNRSGFLALTYASLKMGIDYDMLFDTAKRQRPCILQNLVFMNQTKEFVNGRVQSEKAARDKLTGDVNWDIGLIASRHRSDSEGVQDHAGDLEDRSRDLEDGDSIPTFE